VPNWSGNTIVFLRVPDPPAGFTATRVSVSDGAKLCVGAMPTAKGPGDSPKLPLRTVRIF